MDPDAADVLEVSVHADAALTARAIEQSVLNLLRPSCAYGEIYLRSAFHMIGDCAKSLGLGEELQYSALADIFNGFTEVLVMPTFVLDALKIYMQDADPEPLEAALQMLDGKLKNGTYHPPATQPGFYMQHAIDSILANNDVLAGVDKTALVHCVQGKAGKLIDIFEKLAVNKPPASSEASSILIAFVGRNGKAAKNWLDFVRDANLFLPTESVADFVARWLRVWKPAKARTVELPANWNSKHAGTTLLPLAAANKPPAPATPSTALHQRAGGARRRGRQAAHAKAMHTMAASVPVSSGSDAPPARYSHGACFLPPAAQASDSVHMLDDLPPQRALAELQPGMQCRFAIGQPWVRHSDGAADLPQRDLWAARPARYSLDAHLPNELTFAPRRSLGAEVPPRSSAGAPLLPPLRVARGVGRAARVGAAVLQLADLVAAWAWGGRDDS